MDFHNHKRKIQDRVMEFHNPMWHFSFMVMEFHNHKGKIKRYIDPFKNYIVQSYIVQAIYIYIYIGPLDIQAIWLLYSAKNRIKLYLSKLYSSSLCISKLYSSKLCRGYIVQMYTYIYKFIFEPLDVQSYIEPFEGTLNNI